MMALFFLLGGLVLASGIAVVALRNPIHSALSLVVNLVSVAGLFALLEAHFLAVVQIIVYAGAIMVLFLFVIMLLNVKVEAAKQYGTLLLISAGVAGACFLSFLAMIFRQGFSAVPEGTTTVVGGVAEIGQVLYTRYIFTFEVASLLIIAAIVGAVMVAKRRRAAPQLSMRKP